MLALPNPASAISTRFTSPLKLFEYMAAGPAIVASDLPSIREVLHDDVDALLVTPGDAAALAAAIDAAARRPGAGRAAGRAALRRGAGLFMGAAGRTARGAVHRSDRGPRR